MVLPLSADLEVAKVAPDTVTGGDTFTYTVTVTNNGPDDATGVELVDTLPVSVTFVSASTGCTEVDGVVTCDLGDMAAAEVATVLIVVTAPDEAGTVTNTAVVTSEVADPDATNNTTSVDVEVEAA